MHAHALGERRTKRETEKREIEPKDDSRTSKRPDAVAKALYLSMHRARVLLQESTEALKRSEKEEQKGMQL